MIEAALPEMPAVRSPSLTLQRVRRHIPSPRTTPAWQRVRDPDFARAECWAVECESERRGQPDKGRCSLRFRPVVCWAELAGLGRHRPGRPAARAARRSPGTADRRPGCTESDWGDLQTADARN